MFEHLPTGTDYERLLDSMRLKIPWATATFLGDPIVRPSATRSTETSISAADLTPPSQIRDELISETVGRIARDRRADPSEPEPVWMTIDRFAEGAPERVALSQRRQVVTYGQLRSRTDELAAVLRARGVRSGDVVPLLLDRGIGLIEAMLSVWKVGAAFLPVDPAAPPAWQARTVEFTQATHYVTTSPSAGLPGAARIDLDTLRLNTLTVAGDANVQPGPAAAAYVIRTSGSTGFPKLVVVGHQGVGNLLRVVQAEIGGLGADAVVLQFSSPYLDGVIFDLVMGLGTGSRLEVFEGLAESQDVPLLLDERGITHVALPAAIVRLMDPDDVPALRVLLSVGDVCLTETAAQWSRRLTFINGYGPTETTVCATLNVVDPQQLPRSASVPIGRPVAGVHVVLVDDRGELVPDGTPGEICIGGRGVAMGYLGQPEESGRHFYNDPYSPVPGARLYRTGDLGQWQSDGTLVFLGRRDEQVKVRGFRVEPTEVQHALVQVPGVADAIVVFHQGASAGTLVGYVRSANGHVLDGAGVHAELANAVPAYLVPSAVLVVDEWPLTANGKVDRSRLPRPAGAPSVEEKPRTPVEDIVASLAAQLLGLDRVGLDEVFFALGGHSLLATQLVAGIKTLLGKELELSAVLDGATVREIAAAVESRAAGTIADPSPAPPNTPLVPSSMQQRVWLTHNIEPDSVAYNAQGVLRLKGDLNVDALRASVSSYVRRYDVLRSRLPFRDGELQLELEEPWTVDLPIIDLTGLTATERNARLGAAIRAHVRTRFVLEEGRLIRWLLFKTAGDEHLLAHVEHHAVHDGWSFNVYLHEVILGYCDYSAYGEVRRPDPPIQYHDFGIWQRRWLKSAEAERQRRYWRAELDGATTILSLPTRNRSRRRRFDGGDPRIDFGAELAGQLDMFSREHGVTLYMTMLAAFYVVLHRYSGSEDILLGSGFANRRWSGSEDMVGMFINSVLLRGRLDGDPTFHELLTRVRRTCLHAHDNQELPFEDILRELDFDRVAGANALVQALFTFHDVPHMRLDNVPLDITALEGMSNGTAKFDLNIIIVPRYATPGYITCQPGNIVHIPRGTPVEPSPRRELAGITLSWEYDSDLFDEHTISGMIDAYLTVLRVAVSEPDTQISNLPMMSSRVEAAILDLGVGAEAPVEHWLPSRIDEWVDRAPNRTAVDVDGAQLTYRELGMRVERLAGRLAGTGVGQGSVVAICLPRSCERVIAMLAILRLGAAFVDVEGPPTEAVLQAANAEFTVTFAVWRDRVPDGHPVILAVDTEPDERAQAISVVRRPQDVAYIHVGMGPYGVTSVVPVTLTEVAGSVVVPEGAVVVSCVDSSAAVILGCLADGATLYLTTPQVAPMLLLGQPITHCYLDPVTFVVGFVPQAGPSIQRVVLCGGDIDPVAVVAALAGGVGEVANTYGLAETGLFRTMYAVGSADQVDTTAPVPIGRPLPHCRVAVVDDHSRLVPYGMVGSLRVEGVGFRLVTSDLAAWSADRTLVPHTMSAPRPEAAAPPMDAATPTNQAEDVEASLTRLISEVLIVDTVERQDSFFDLGGDSLLAMTLLARLKATFGVDISLGALLADATVADLTREILARSPLTEIVALPARRETAKP